MNETQTVVRAMDTTAGDEICVHITTSLRTSESLVVLADATMIPVHRNYLTVVEARKLAEFLTEQADIADGLNA